MPATETSEFHNVDLSEDRVKQLMREHVRVVFSGEPRQCPDLNRAFMAMRHLGRVEQYQRWWHEVKAEVEADPKEATA